MSKYSEISPITSIERTVITTRSTIKSKLSPERDTKTLFEGFAENANGITLFTSGKSRRGSLNIMQIARFGWNTTKLGLRVAYCDERIDALAQFASSFFLG